MSFNSKLSSGIESHSAFVSYMHSINWVRFNSSYLFFFSFNSGNLEVTVDFLTEIDQLVQLIESPIFACKYRQIFVSHCLAFFNLNFFVDLRIELLEPEKNGPIVHTLYGLLMLLPQSEAFHTLRRRLECVAHLRPLADNRCWTPSILIHVKTNIYF